MLTDRDAKLIAKYICQELHSELAAIARQTRQQVTEEISDEILSFAQAAEYLKMPQNTLRKRLRDIPHHQEGPRTKIRFFKNELKHFIS